MDGSAVSASASARAEPFSIVRRALRRTLSLWGFGAAAGLLSLPPRAWASEPEAVSGGDPGPDPDPDLAGELCPALTEGTLLAPEESCDLPAEAASASREPALLTVLGSDVRLDGLPDLSGLSERQAGLILSQVPESTAAGGGFFGTSGTGLAIGAGVVGGGAILVLASGGSDNGDNGGERRRHAQQSQPERGPGDDHGRPGDADSDGGRGGHVDCLGVVLGPGHRRHADLHGDGQSELAGVRRGDGGL